MSYSSNFSFFDPPVTKPGVVNGLMDGGIQMRTLASAFALAAFAVAFACMLWGCGEDTAAFQRDLSGFLPLKNQVLGWYDPAVQTAAEDIAAEGIDLTKPAGIDDDLSRAVVFFVKQMDQLPGGAAVEIAFYLHMQIAVMSFDFHIEIAVHPNFPFPGEKFSVS